MLPHPDFTCVLGGQTPVPRITQQVLYPLSCLFGFRHSFKTKIYLKPKIPIAGSDGLSNARSSSLLQLTLSVGVGLLCFSLTLLRPPSRRHAQWPASITRNSVSKATVDLTWLLIVFPCLPNSGSPNVSHHVCRPPPRGPLSCYVSSGMSLPDLVGKLRK